MRKLKKYSIFRLYLVTCNPEKAIYSRLKVQLNFLSKSYIHDKYIRHHCVINRL